MNEDEFLSAMIAEGDQVIAEMENGDCDIADADFPPGEALDPVIPLEEIPSSKSET